MSSKLSFLIRICIVMSLLRSSSETEETSEVQVLNVGVLIEDSLLYRTYFNFAMNQTNTEMQRNSMPFRFRPLFRVVKNVNHVLAAVCDLVEFRDTQSRPGIIAVFSPKDALFSAMIQDFGNQYLIPVLHYGKKFQLDKSPNSMLINLYPHFSASKLLLRDTISFYNWTSYAILYDDEERFRSLEYVLRDVEKGNKTFEAWKLTNDEAILTRTLKKLRAANYVNVIVDTAESDLRPLLTKLQRMQILSSKYHYVFNNFHIADYDLVSYLEGELNFTAFQLLDQDSDEHARIETAFKWAVIHPPLTRIISSFNQNRLISFDFALILDSVKLLRLGLAQMLSSSEFQPDLISCSGNYFWRQGHSFINYIRYASAETAGLTGPLDLNGFGEREKLSATILQRVADKVQIVGNWSAENGANITLQGSNEFSLEMLNNRTLRITTIVQPPFTMLKDSEVPLYDNEQYEGYCVELLEAMKTYMSKDGINFQYRIHLVKDGSYGKKQEDGSWNGMVGELQRGEADLAVAPLTINYQRQDDIDFSTPFMNLGISILFRRRETRTPHIYSFLLPLHMDIWMYLIVSYLFISTALFVLSRFTPFERELPDDPSLPKLTLSNSFWFSAGAMMQQGSEIVPQAISTRIVSVAWMFHGFCFFMFFCAKLISTITVFHLIMLSNSNMNLSESDWWALLSNPNIQFGALDGGTTQEYLEHNSQFPTLVRMFQYMENNKDASYVDSTASGIERVEQEDYAFFMESTMIEYLLFQRCNLTQVGGLIDSKFYGIGLRKGSPYTAYVSKAILQMQDDGVLLKLKTKWWEERGRCSKGSSSGGEDANALKLDSIGGIFIVLVGGVAVGFLVAIAEFFWKIRKYSKYNKTSVWAETKVFLKRAYRKENMFFSPLPRVDDKDSDDDSKSNEAKQSNNTSGNSGLSLYTNVQASHETPTSNPILPVGSQLYSPQPFQLGNDQSRFGTLPLSVKHSLNDDTRRVNSANSTLKNSTFPKSALKLRFSPTVEKQVFCQEHSSDQLSFNNSASAGNNQHSVIGNGTSEAGTQTKNVRIKTDTDV